MATLQQVEDHARLVDDLTVTAIGDLVSVWREFDLSDVQVTNENLAELLSALVGDYGSMASEIALDWYDSLRDFAQASPRYTALAVDLPSVERIRALAGWSTQPLTLDQPDTGLALSRVSGGMQRLLAGIERDTVASNSGRDPADARYARHASANACAFCALLATREDDWLYRTAHSATRVVTTRGVRPLGERYHDDCRCVAVPVWPDSGDTFEEAPYVERWRAAYGDAASDSSDLREILARMRTSAGLR